VPSLQSDEVIAQPLKSELRIALLRQRRTSLRLEVALAVVRGQIGRDPAAGQVKQVADIQRVKLYWTIGASTRHPLPVMAERGFSGKVVRSPQDQQLLPSNEVPYLYRGIDIVQVLAICRSSPFNGRVASVVALSSKLGWLSDGYSRPRRTKSGQKTNLMKTCVESEGFGVAKKRSAKPLCVGSIPTRASSLLNSLAMPAAWG
jgi:hypothetical protein